MPLHAQPLLDVHDKLVIDLFAGGGGASVGIEMGIGRMVDIAINHDAAAVQMHWQNHPQTEHHTSDVLEIDPRLVTRGRPIGLLWASPDCTYHSKARGGKPIRSKLRKRRALAWVVTRWAGQVRPDVIMLENVEEFADWGPLVGPPDALRPCPRRKGRSFRRWVRSLTDLGYAVEWRELRACDYGAPTIRKRLFLIARCDGLPIVWPLPTHGAPTSAGVKAHALKPYRTASECIDWSIPMLSIFATKEEARDWGKFYGQASPIRPLAENTNKRIARGVMRYVVNNPRPFIVRTDMGSAAARNGVHGLDEPTRTMTTGGSFAVVSPVVAGVGGRAGQSPERSADSPLGTVTAKGDAAVVAPVMVQSNHGDKPYSGADEPVRTIMAGGTHHAVVAPMIAPITHQGERNTPTADEPLKTVTTAHRGEFGLVAPYMVPRYGEREGQEPRSRSIEEPAPVIVPDGNGGSLVAANLSTYYGAKSETDARGANLEEPLHTQPTENRHAVVASFLGQHNGGFAEGNSGDGHSLEDPASTISTKGPHQSLVTAHIQRDFGQSVGAPADAPVGTITPDGQGKAAVVAASMTHANTGHTPNSAADDPLHTIVADGARHSVVGAFLDQNNNGFDNRTGRSIDEPNGTVCAMGSRQTLVGAFLQTYYGQGTGQAADTPLRTIPTLDNFGCVTVQIDGQTYVIEDIAMRMLQPHELYRAQGFPAEYVIDRGADGRKLTKTEQVRMCGNSVCPPVAAALAKANVPHMIARRELIA